LQKISHEKITRNIMDIYKKMMDDLIRDINLIPSNNLMEVSFEQLESNPDDLLKTIYKNLDLPGFEQAWEPMSEYIDKMKGYKKNKHKISKEQLDTVLQEWKFAMDKWSYEIPDNIEIIDGQNID
ncbi:MAG: sulfotransferase, partial [Bacteroidales bacterium]|nr:sulfotransferase [Bacteroidales bacterium]